MKNKLLSLLLMAMLGIGMIATPSCKKYEEGPGFSLASKKARLAGKWKTSKYIYPNGVSDSSIDEEGILEFDKDGSMSLISTDPSIPISLPGTWKFENNKQDLTITFSFFGSSESDTFEIILLKNDELGVKDKDGVKMYYVPA